MKNAIKEYLEMNEINKKELWKTSLFVFDTNVLLNLYRLSQKTRNIFFDILKKLKERIWIPYHVAKEFMENRISVINEVINKYDSLKKSTEKLFNECVDTFGIKANEKGCVNKKQSLLEWIESTKINNKIVTDYNNDEILNTVLKLFENKTGPNFSTRELEKLYVEGDERYKKHIPPGYKDSKKSKEDFDNNQYGDLIIWKQIIKQSNEIKKDIIFITNDQKEDWWNQSNGKIIGPRYELRKEFCDETNKKIHFYNLTNFIEYSENKIDSNILYEIQTSLNKDNELENNYEHYIYDEQEKDNDERLIKFLKHLINKESYYLRENIKIVKELEREYENNDMPEDVENYLNMLRQRINFGQMKIDRNRKEIEKMLYKNIVKLNSINNT